MLLPPAVSLIFQELRCVRQENFNVRTCIDVLTHQLEAHDVYMQERDKQVIGLLQEVLKGVNNSKDVGVVVDPQLLMESARLRADASLSASRAPFPLPAAARPTYPAAPGSSRNGPLIPPAHPITSEISPVESDQTRTNRSPPHALASSAMTTIDEEHTTNHKSTEPVQETPETSGDINAGGAPSGPADEDPGLLSELTEDEDDQQPPPDIGRGKRKATADNHQPTRSSKRTKISKRGRRK